tara:strand:+ start:70 stop:669 length:600 start_codon:yes stop_codon:yes gene_type:complete
MKEPRWKSYVVIVPEPILTPQQCQEFIRLGQAEPQSDGTVMGGGKHTKQDYTARKSKISWIPFDKAPNTYNIIINWMQNVNMNHFAFDNMQLNEPGQYTEYSKGDFYNWHVDIGINAAPMPIVRKISMSLLLNDPKEFEGGELEMFSRSLSDDPTGNLVQPLKQGQALFFASFQVHRVRPITSGKRKALVMWFGGTPLK